MSYNTRRGGPGGAGRTPATQVNYHQQPSRPGTNTTAQNRNPGYTTSNQSSYNSSAQPAYTTQTGYSTTAPPPPSSQPKPQPPPAVTQPPLPAAQPQTTPAAKPPATPVLKQEPPTPTDTPKMDTATAENGDGSTKPFWKKRPFVKVSNKVRKARQNAKLRRILNPKNALTFLNELRPGGVKFNVREEAGWGYVSSVDIDGKTFSGHALTISKAKVQASEQALKHLLLEQLSKSPPAVSPPTDKKDENTVSIKEDEDADEMDTSEQEEGGEPKPKKSKLEQPEDDLPWGSLAAFALHKLFAEWQKEGAEVGQHEPEDKYEEEIGEEAYFTRRPALPEFGYTRRFGPGGPYPARGRGYAPYPPRGPPPPAFGIPRRPPPPAASFIRPALPLGGAASSMLPMKKIPDDANKRHPVMILNQLKPNVVYNESREGQPPRVTFSISVELEGKEFIGRGKNKKEAKKNAAKAALAPLGILYNE